MRNLTIFSRRSAWTNAILLLFSVAFLLSAAAETAFAGNYRDAKQKFQNALRKKNTEKARKYALKMVESKNKRGVHDLIDTAKRLDNRRLYYTILSAFGGVQSWDALKTVMGVIRDSRENIKLRYDLFWSLKLNSSDYAGDVMMAFLKGDHREFKTLAITEVANRRIKEAIPVLIDVLDSEGKQTEPGKRAIRALESLTDESFGSAARWRSWWKKNKGSVEVTEAGPGKLERRLRGTKREAHDTITEQDKTKIVVLEGLYDDISKALRMLKIPHKAVDREEFQNMDLKNADALLINCGAGLKLGDEVTGKTRKGKEVTNDEVLANPFSDRELKKIKQFVARGGYLFTSDWGLFSVTERIFGNYISYPDLGPKDQSNIFDRYGGPRDDLFTRIWPVRGANCHNLMTDVFINTKYVNVSGDNRQDGDTVTGNEGNVEKTLLNFKWHIDDRKRLIEVKHRSVVPLIWSPELAEKNKGYGIIAATFLVGGQARNPKVKQNGIVDSTPKLQGGRVLHTLGHLKKQTDPKKDGFALQKLMVNFLIEAISRD